MCKIFLKIIDNWGFPKPPKFLMFLTKTWKLELPAAEFLCKLVVV